MTRDELIAFEEDIAARFNRGEIPHPVHLSGGNEDQLIAIFKDIDAHDWVCGQWRMHYQCLLHGVPPDELRAAILSGRSIALCFPEYNIVSSAIVGGVCPIAVGLAWQIKRTGGNNKVHCFVGDMTWRTGGVIECAAYAAKHELPLEWVVEQNGLSVCTPVEAVWPVGPAPYARCRTYDYVLPWPHAGAGQRVQF